MSDNVTLWQLVKNITIDRDTVLWIFGTAVDIIVPLAIFLGNRIAKRTDARIKDQREKLMKHFEEIKGEVQNKISPYISSITQINGKIFVLSNFGIPHQVTDYELPTLSESLKVHFLSEVKNLLECSQRVKQNNANSYEFDQELTNKFKSIGLDVLPNNVNIPLVPFIYENIYTPLLVTWQQRHRGENLRHDFTKIETRPQENPDNLYVSNWGHAIAHKKTDVDQERCKEAILKVMEDKKLEYKSNVITEHANVLVREINNIIQNLDNKLNDLKNYNLKIQGYQFKRKDSRCPRCRQLFKK